MHDKWLATPIMCQDRQDTNQPDSPSIISWCVVHTRGPRRPSHLREGDERHKNARIGWVGP